MMSERMKDCWICLGLFAAALLVRIWLTDWLYRVSRYSDYTVGQSPVWLFTHLGWPFDHFPLGNYELRAAIAADVMAFCSGDAVALGTRRHRRLYAVHARRRMVVACDYGGRQPGAAHRSKLSSVV